MPSCWMPRFPTSTQQKTTDDIRPASVVPSLPAKNGKGVGIRIQGAEKTGKVLHSRFTFTLSGTNWEVLSLVSYVAAKHVFPPMKHGVSTSQDVTGMTKPLQHLVDDFGENAHEEDSQRRALSAPPPPECGSVKVRDRGSTPRIPQEDEHIPGDFPGKTAPRTALGRCGRSETSEPIGSGHNFARRCD